MFENPDSMQSFTSQITRSLSFKSQFILYGNINDLFINSLSKEIDSDFINLKTFITYILKKNAYKCICYYDVYKGFSFSDQESQNYFFEIIDNKFKQFIDNISNNNALDIIRQISSNKKILSAIFLDLDLSLDIKLKSNLIIKHIKNIKKIGFDQVLLNNFYNAHFFLCEDLFDILKYLYLNNPFTYIKNINLPDVPEKIKVLQKSINNFYINNQISKENSDFFINQTASNTKGFMITDLLALQKISQTEQIPISDWKLLLNFYKFGDIKNKWDNITPKYLDTAYKNLCEEIIGQNEVIFSILDILKRAKLNMTGIQNSECYGKPRAILFFAGPTGVGKTKISTALAKILFGSEKYCLKYNMGDYSNEYSIDNLFYSKESILKALFDNPFCVILFEEIERAHPKIIDKLMFIMENGYIKDSFNNNVYFSESIIIYTSNIRSAQGVIGDKKYDFSESGFTPKYEIIKQLIRLSLENQYRQKIGRPEFFNYLGDNIIIFDFIRNDAIWKIIQSILANVCIELEKQKNIKIQIEMTVIKFIHDLAFQNIENGARGIGNIIERVFVNPLARYIFDKSISNNRLLVISNISMTNKNGTNVYELEIVNDSIIDLNNNSSLKNKNDIDIDDEDEDFELDI